MPALRQLPVPSGTCRRGNCVGGLHYTTRQPNAHRTTQRELLYPWHPWAGHQVHIHKVIDKNDATVFRCSLSGRASDRWLEVPAWMFDRVSSARWQITAAPYVEFAALGALAVLLRDTSTTSQMQEMGAILNSHEANRGDIHAAPIHERPVRPVLKAERCQDGGDTAMAGAAGGDTAVSDDAYGEPDPRSHRRRAHSRTGGNAS